MSSFLQLKKKLEARKALSRNESTYKVPEGWTTILKKKPDHELWKGHHHYTGIRVDTKHGTYFAARDLVLSKLFAYGKAHENRSEDEKQGGIVLDLFCDLLLRKNKQPANDKDLYPFLKKAAILDRTLMNEENIKNALSVLPDNHSSENEIVSLITKCKLMRPEFTDSELDFFVFLYSGILMFNGLKGELAWAIMLLLIDLSKSGNPSEGYLERKAKSFILCQSRNAVIFSDSISQDCILVIWQGIQDRLQDNLTPEALVANLQILVASITNVAVFPIAAKIAYRQMTALKTSITNVAVFPIAAKIAYRQMTALKIISDAYSSLPSFPWVAVFEQHAILKSEFERYISILKLIGNSPHAGLTVGGINAGLKNLSFRFKTSTLDISRTFHSKIGLEPY
ncbi:hypothetical protein QE152_g274 [Popillia japonica]|uniref:Uncharacterized protein n=1 Tax=Popillia japonica TaxID=7064 RepID=A0AAW1NJZ7_POPJA